MDDNRIFARDNYDDNPLDAIGVNTIPTQKNATYTEVPEEQFINTAFDSFVENIESPTPQLKKICGIECTKS
jgi:hypothetical protein